LKDKLNQKEKQGIRTMASFITQGKNNQQTLNIIDTRANKYSIILQYTSNNGLQYSVEKRAKKSGHFYGIFIIKNVSQYGIEYDRLNEKDSLPDSVVKYIILHYITFNRYINIGENAFV